MSKINQILNFFKSGLAVEKKHNPLSWAEEYIYLSSVDSSEGGTKYSAERTPYVKEPLLVLSSDNSIKEVSLMWGAQLGKTRTLLNFLGYCIDADAGPIIISLGSLPVAKDWSKERLTPLIDETPKLKEKFKNTSRDKDNAILSKTFPGGKLKIVSAAVASSLRSTPIRYALMDEIDSYPRDVQNEGSPIDLLRRRTNTFNNKKIVKVSTPTIKGCSNIEDEYDKSDKRKYNVPCPHCNHYQELRFENLKYKEFEVNNKTKKCISDSVYYECEKCKNEIKEKHKTFMLKNGKWIITNPLIKDHAGFHLNSLYCPIGWFSWEDIVNEFIEARNDQNKLKQFINTILAETYEEDNVEIEVEKLIERKENYSFFECSDDIILITAGVDVQEDRLALVILGFGCKEQVQVLYHNEIFGDTTKDEVYEMLISILETPFKHKSGIELKVRRAFIDSGGKITTKQVYKMCAKYKNLLVSSKGFTSKNDMILKTGKNRSVNLNGKLITNIPLILINTKPLKDEFFMRLNIDDFEANKYVHFGKDLTDEFFNQLTSEKLIYEEKNGVIDITYKKTKSTIKNEALDCFIYALAVSYMFIDYKFNFEKEYKKVHKVKYEDVLVIENKKIEENKDKVSDKIDILNNKTENIKVEKENTAQNIMKSLLKSRKKGKWM